MSSLPAPIRDESFDKIVDLSLPENLTARVIEVGDLTAGIAVPERGGVRFYSSERSFDALDGTLFRSVEQAARVARERKRGGDSGLRHSMARARVAS